MDAPSGDVSWGLWADALRRCGSPIYAEGHAPYEAARPHSALALAAMEYLTGCGTADPRFAAHRNPFNVQLGGSFPGLVAYDAWAEAVAAWSPDELRFLPEGARWQIANRAAELQAQDRAGDYGYAVPGCFDDEGYPLTPVLARYHGGAGLHAYDPDHPVCAAWRDWCFAHGLYPEFVCVFIGVGDGNEYHYHGGLRIWSNGTRTFVVGQPPR